MAKAKSSGVKMKNGESIEFGARQSTRVIPTFTNGEWSHSTIYFRSGQVITVPRPDNRELREQALAFGIKQRVLNGTLNKETPKEVQDAVAAAVERISKGEWAQRGVGNGAAGATVFQRAVAEFIGKPLADVRAKLKGMTNEQRKAMRESDELRPILARLRAADSKAAPVAVGALFKELRAN